MYCIMIKLKIDNCSGCGYKKPIVNKKYYLCDNCNYERINGKTKTEKRIESVNKLKRNTLKNKQSSGLGEVYKEIEKERPKICSGCGSPDFPLSHSHLIPRSRRSDLVNDKRNIQYHCLTIGERVGCHDRWESGDMWNMLDYEDNMEYIKETDPIYYQILKNKEDAKVN